MEYQREFEFTREDFDYLRKVVSDTTGIVSSEDKYTMYYSRLVRRVRKLGLKDFHEYRNYLNQHKESEIIELVNSVTTNLTSFFRENHHFEFLAATIIPDIVKRGEKTIRIWSAGCSTGEEPYSIAMTLVRAIPDIASWNVEIFASDLDSNVVAHGKRGVYEANRVDSLDTSLVKQFFKKGTGDDEGYVQVIPDLQKMIRFRQLNLLHDWPIHEIMDCIFCRNVVIYFDKPTKNSLVDRFADQLKQDGYLFMGHSESLYKSTERFTLLGKTIYQKVGN